MSVLKRGNDQNWHIQFRFRGETYIRISRTTDKRLAEHLAGSKNDNSTQTELFRQ